MILVPLLAAAITTLLLWRTASDGFLRSPAGPDDRPPSAATPRRVAPTWFPHRRRARVDPAGVAAWCDDLARSLRHGSTLRSALGAVVPETAGVEAHAARLRHRLERGATLTDACDAWSADLEQVTTPGTEALATLAAVLSAAALLGGDVAEPLDRFAVAMRQQASQQLERAAQSAQARLSARVLTTIPLAMLGVLVAADREVRSAATSSAGMAAIGAGVVLNASGGWWMRRIAGSAATVAGVATGARR